MCARIYIRYSLRAPLRGPEITGSLTPYVRHRAERPLHAIAAEPQRGGICVVPPLCYSRLAPAWRGVLIPWRRVVSHVR